MFDWNDEELYGMDKWGNNARRVIYRAVFDTRKAFKKSLSCVNRLSNIIWGEDGENEDHIVPYPDGKGENRLGYGDCIKKEQKQEAVNIKSTEPKKTTGVKWEHSPHYNKNDGFPPTEFNLDSWADQESLDTEIPDSMTKLSRHDVRIDDKAALLNTTSEIFESQLEDNEQGDFVDYSWAGVGSFEDLDRIFSNEEAIFKPGSLGNPDELWSPSIDVFSSPEKSIPTSGDSPCLAFGSLRKTPEQFEGQGADQNQSLTPGYKNLNLLAADVPMDMRSCLGNIKYPGSDRKPLLKEKTAFKMGGSNSSYNLELDTRKVAGTNEYMDKGNKQKKLVKGRKKLEVKSEARHLQNIQGWTQTGRQFLQFESPYVPNEGQASSSLMFNRQGQLRGAESPQYKHFPGPLLTSFMPGSVTKQYPSKPVLSYFHSGEGSKQLAFSSFEVSPSSLNPLNQSTESHIKSSVMTPQEKIEKLRRRQQLRAMVAIQKQQQQFGNQVPSAEYSVTEGEYNEAEENLSIHPLLDPNSPVEQDDSSTVFMARDGYSVQDSILHQLQDIVGKLDLRVRLCIRDSLFRLAQSASQRQYASDTNSSNKSGRDDIARKEETNSQNRFPKLSEVETETNPIDRTVAHLLFHRHLEFSGKLGETPDSPSATKLKPSSSMSLLNKSLSQRSETNQILSHEAELPSFYPKQGQLKNRTSLDASENASAITGANNGKKVEGSL